MRLYQENDYKLVIRKRIEELKPHRPGLTLCKLAEQSRIQYTYLSRVLNQPNAQLSSDQLFTVAAILDFQPEEIDYLQLIRSRAITQSEERKTVLSQKIEKLRAQQAVDAPTQQLETSKLLLEIRYLLEPLMVITHMALQIPRFRHEPRLLTNVLSISIAKLREILKVLAELQMIELGKKDLEIKKILRDRLHYGVDHPLMQAHQNALKVAADAKFQSLPLQDRARFMAIFSADEEAFGKIRNEFQKFLREAENISKHSNNTRVYQLRFDLFPWI